MSTTLSMRRSLLLIAGAIGRPALAAALAGALAGALAACGHASPWGEGRGFGVDEPTPRPSLASQNWGVKLKLDPSFAAVTEKPESWTATNADHASTTNGQFTFIVLRNAKIDGAKPEDVAERFRSDEVERGAGASEVATAEFLGRPGAMFITTPGANLYNITVLTVADKCVYVLSVVREGDQAQAADYAASLIDDISTYDGGPVHAPACR